MSLIITVNIFITIYVHNFIIGSPTADVLVIEVF